MFQNALLVGLGGFMGAVARYLLGAWVAQRWPGDFPYGTFIINVTGSFILGFFLTLTLRLGWWDGWRLMVAVGFVGAYTTFSTFEYETLRLLTDGARIQTASAYVASSLVCGLAAAWVGVTIANLLVKLRGA